ncbi:MAG: methylated-DNA--[protein]-cysteine S-methyltransferase [Pseudomonadota bacterium]
MKRAALFYTYFESPVGSLLLAGDETSLHYLSFPGGHKAFGPASTWERSNAPFGQVKRQLSEYFAGTRDRFDFPLTLNGTDFQKRLWRLLLRIPFGETRTYGALAKELGKPNASRAVGTANGANPIPIIIPCHRVIGSNGSLTGFGGGLETKQALLDLERVKALPERLTP